MCEIVYGNLIPIVTSSPAFLKIRNNIEKAIFYNEEFKKWLRDHDGQTRFVEAFDENAVKLKGVYFWLTRDFIE